MTTRTPLRAARRPLTDPSGSVTVGNTDADPVRKRRPRAGSSVKPYRSFDPRQVGGLEAAAWVAYYRHEWVAFLRSAVALTNKTFGLSWPSTIHGAWLVLRANQLWAPTPTTTPPALAGPWSASTGS